MSAAATWGLVAFLTTPMQITGVQHLMLLGPLCVAISIIYKTIRCQDLREVPLAALIQCVTIILGMLGVGVAVWLLYLLLA
jgi:hypothetical protein